MRKKRKMRKRNQRRRKTAMIMKIVEKRGERKHRVKELCVKGGGGGCI
jgi:hypothetical protein